jgi:hypothetical protein
VWSGVDDRYPPSTVSLKVRCRAMAHVPVEPAGSPRLSSRLNGQRQADGVRALR